MLSLTELRRAAALLESRLRGHRVQGISQPEADSVVFSTWGRSGSEGSGAKHHLLFSCRPGAARVALLPSAPAALPAPPAFSQFLRAHAANARIAGFRLIDDDRQLAMRLRTGEADFDVLLAIFGRRSNLLVLDADGRVAVAMRPLAETRPELALGDTWTSPASRAPTQGSDRFADVPDERYLEAIEAAYAGLREKDDTAALRAGLERVFRKELRALDRKLDKIRRTISEAEQAAGLEREGELLKGALSRVKRGDSEIRVSDFESGEEVRIALDPKLAPAENLARLFKRYQKAVRGLAKAGAQQEEVLAARDGVAALAARLQAAAPEAAPADADALAELAAHPEVRSLLKKYAQRAPSSRAEREGPVRLGRREVPRRLMPRRYATAGGLEVWVGRSDEANDFLTTRLARGRDLFFHLDGAPGSHVILRTEGRTDPPSDAVLDACELAVHFSKAKSATRADVHVVPIKNVKKPRGAKPGLVMVHGGKTVHLKRMQTRLARILDARIEDGD